ncbi:uncharacterized protein LOC128183588 [Crassostrea angulata]|uniref:uncharacterized protein LOC128183588 n=1 Tax=Magallana angulata TaxID=2784310 RepID=UPI0022B1D2E8|nr:uncharacterized protein LOC128183588 [Crassostrea angulata]
MTPDITLKIAAGDYDVLVRFLEYNRDKDTDCDGLFVSGEECDVYFKVCLQPLSPKQRLTCSRSYSELENTYHLVFSRTQWRYFTYSWKGIRGQPIFNILVHVYDLDPVGDDDYLGMTIYTHLGSGSTVRTVTTTPSHKNLRIKFLVEVTCLSPPSKSLSTTRASTPGKSLSTIRASTPGKSRSTIRASTPGKRHSTTRASTPGKRHSTTRASTPGKSLSTTRASTPGKSLSTTCASTPGKSMKNNV